MPFQLAVFCPVTKRRATVLAMCNAYFDAHNLHGNVVSFTSLEDIWEEPFDYDAYLLPLDAPENRQRMPDGLLLAKKLRSKGMFNPIIFVATSPEWAYEAYRVNALQYLPIPLSADLLYPALERAVKPTRSPAFALHTANGIHAIPFREIETVECTNHTLLFHRYARSSICSLTLRVPLRTALAPLLQDIRFVQPHRSYVINLSQVEQLGAGEFIMKSGATIPVSRERYANMKASFVAFLADGQRRSLT